MKKLAIIGGGVAGLSAAIYALRANAEVTIFEQFGLGGLVATIDKIDNYPSYQSVEGWKLADDMSRQAKALGLKTVRQKVLSLTKTDNDFTITTDKGTYQFPAVVVATGTAHNKLGIEGNYVGKGVSYCATCDGNFYKNCVVAVVGGTSVAVKEATYLADIAATVHVFAPTAAFAAPESAVDNLLGKPNVHVAYNATVAEIGGEQVVQYLTAFVDGAKQQIAVDGIFVAIGALPVTDFIKVEGVRFNKGYVVVDNKCQTDVAGLFAAGDVTDGPLKQIVTACGDGAKAGSFATIHAAIHGKNN